MGCCVSRNLNLEDVKHVEGTVKELIKYDKLEQLVTKKENEQREEKVKKSSNKEKNVSSDNNLNLNDIIHLIQEGYSLIEGTLERSQIAKILMRLLKHIELELINSSNTKFEIVNEEEKLYLISTLKEIKEYCLNYSEISRSFGLDKVNNCKRPENQLQRFSFANQRLNKVFELNSELMKIVESLKIPNSDEDLKICQMVLDQLKEYNEKITIILGSETKVSVCAQHVLTNEEALLFWIENFPERFIVSINEFSAKIKEWIQKYKGIDLEETVFEEIIVFLKSAHQEEKEIVITAQEFSTFMGSLPLDVKWEEIDVMLKEIKRNQAERIDKAERKFKMNELEFQEKYEKINNSTINEEKELINNPKYMRFIINEAWKFKDGIRDDLNIQNLFIDPITGQFVCYGYDKKGAFKLEGKSTYFGYFVYDKVYIGKNPPEAPEGCEVVGFIGDNGIDGQIALCGGSIEGDYNIVLDLDRWHGTSYTDKNIVDMRGYFKIFDKNIIGLTIDVVGISLWQGTVIDSVVKMDQQYISRFLVNYIGKYQRNGLAREIKGDWKGNDVGSGSYFVSFNDEKGY